MESVYQPKHNQSRRHQQQHQRSIKSSCDCYPACKSSRCKNSKSSSSVSLSNNMYNSIDPPDNEYDEESARVLLVQRANKQGRSGDRSENGPRRRVSHTSSSDSPSVASSQYNDPPSNGSGPSICYSSSDDDSLEEVGTRDPPLRSDSNDDTGKRGRQGEGRRGEKRGGLQRRDVHFASSSSSSQQQRRPRGQNKRGKRAIIVDAEDVSHLTISNNYIDTVDQVSLPNDYYDVEAGEVVYDVQTKKKDGRSQRGERRRRVSVDSQSTIASSVESRDTLLKSMMSTVSADSSILTGIRGTHKSNQQHNKYINKDLSKSINKAKQSKGSKMKGKSNGFISSYPRPISFYNMHNIQRSQLNKSKDKDSHRTFFQRLFPSAIKEDDDDDSSIHSSSTSSTSSTNSTASTNNSNRTTKSQASQRSKIGRVANSLLMTWVFTLVGAMIILVVYDSLEPMIVKLMHGYSLHDVDGGGGSGVGEVMRKLINARHAIFHLDAKVDADESGSSFLT